MKRLGQAFVLLVVVAVPASATVPDVIATPEPATLGLVATGVGLVGALTWWRKRR